MLIRRALLAIALAGAASAAAAHTSATPAAPTAPAVPSPAAADRPDKTPSGATFTAPEGWVEQVKPKLIELFAPEKDFGVAVVDVGPAADAKAAAGTAWAAWKPSQNRPPKLITARAPRDGWEERQFVDYETSPNEKRDLYAFAFRKGTAWTVLLVDGNQGTGEKRLAATGLIGQSLRPAGYARERFDGRTAHPMDAARIAELQRFIEQSIQELGVPGAAFALTTREKTIYAGGLGVRLLGDSTPVDGDTEFAVASNTKGMATLMLAKLVDEGKLAWNEPVTQVYPTFRLGSAQTTSKVLVRNLVCACTGLPRKDMQVILNSDPEAAASDTFAQLAATEPTSGFGEVFQYSNLMASAAGYIGGHLAYPALPLDRAFARAMREKVWGPLGMTRTTLDFDQATRGDWARPHADAIDGNPVPILGAGMKLNYAFTRYGAAGGSWSTAGDLIKYVRFELNEGRLDDGQQYISTKNLLQRRVANVAVGEDQVYGMGLEVDRTYGIDVVHHGGSLAGYKTDIIIIPSANVGAVILTNSDNGQSLLRPFMRRLLELLYDGKPEAVADVAASAKRIHAELATERERVSIKPDVQAAAALASNYFNADLGPIAVSRAGSGVQFAFRTMTTPMGTKHNDDGTVSFVALDPTLLFTPLVVGSKDGKRALLMRDGQHEFAFVER